MTLSGATGAVLKRSLAALNALITRSLVEVRRIDRPSRRHFLLLRCCATRKKRRSWMRRGCTLLVPEVDSNMMVRGNRELLQAALGNLIQNALKFAHAHSEVTLHARACGDQVLIEVADHCGGLPVGNAETMFTPFNQRNDDKSGLGICLSIARQSIEADRGALSVRDVPGIGRVFTISLPWRRLTRRIVPVETDLDASASGGKPSHSGTQHREAIWPTIHPENPLEWKRLKDVPVSDQQP